MGACDFTIIGVGKDLNDAFNKAVQDALYEEGHDSYNGTISTTSAPSQPDSIRFKKWSTLQAYVNKQIDKVEKWECRAIELKGKMLKEYKEKHGLKRTRKKVFVFYGLAAC